MNISSAIRYSAGTRPMGEETGKSSGYFLIADISGYTKFLTSNEIEHAKAILDELFRAIIPAISPPLSISGFQGDAIFAYAVDDDITSGQVMLDAAERIYCVFADKREHIRINTTCHCTACTGVAELDLKIIIHHGEYIVQKLRGHDELAGKDVITAFRLLKNSVEEKFGSPAYALITCDAVRAMNLDDFFQENSQVSEKYEHIGEIEYVVHPLRPVWDRKREKQRVIVASDAPLLVPESTMVLPVSVPAAFTIFSRPDLRARWLGADRIDVVSGKGRLTDNVKMHCHHGKQTHNYEIVDWRPGEYFTGRYRFSGCIMDETTEFSSLGNGTMVKHRIGALKPQNLLGALMRPFLQKMAARDISSKSPEQYERIREMAAEMRQSKPALVEPAEADPKVIGLQTALEKRFAA